MVKIFMMQHEENRISNYQSAIGEYESFEDYLEKESTDKALPLHAQFIEKHIDDDRKVFIASFMVNCGGNERKFIHFAQQISE